MTTRRRERGVAAVLVACVLAALLGVIGLVLNVGYRLDTRAELQNAADSSALAAARELNGTLAPISAGAPATQAIYFSGRHTSGASVPVVIGQADVQVGIWDPYAADPWTAFTPANPTNDFQAWSVNAVRVKNGREASRSSALDVWLARFLGDRTKQDVTSEAVAVNGGPCEQGCPTMPFAFFDCNLPQNFMSNCGQTFQIHNVDGTTGPDPGDTMGFTSLTTQVSANTRVFNDILNAQMCDIEIQTGQQINLQNGSGLIPLCDALHQHYMVPGQVAVVAGACPPRFNQNYPIIGFATVMLTAAVGCPWYPERPVGGVSGRILRFQVICCDPSAPQGSPGEIACRPGNTDRTGCGFFGTGYEPKLVR